MCGGNESGALSGWVVRVCPPEWLRILLGLIHQPELS